MTRTTSGLPRLLALRRRGAALRRPPHGDRRRDASGRSRPNQGGRRPWPTASPSSTPP
jgi:hypothetical protein